jgi:hypothetical protein
MDKLRLLYRKREFMQNYVLNRMSSLSSSIYNDEAQAAVRQAEIAWERIETACQEEKE